MFPHSWLLNETLLGLLIYHLTRLAYPVLPRGNNLFSHQAKPTSRSFQLRTVCRYRYVVLCSTHPAKCAAGDGDDMVCLSAWSSCQLRMDSLLLVLLFVRMISRVITIIEKISLNGSDHAKHKTYDLLITSQNCREIENFNFHQRYYLFCGWERVWPRCVQNPYWQSHWHLASPCCVTHCFQFHAHTYTSRPFAEKPTNHSCKLNNATSAKKLPIVRYKCLFAGWLCVFIFEHSFNGITTNVTFVWTTFAKGKRQKVTENNTIRHTT